MSELDDRLGITELLYRYAELIDAGDFDGVGALLARSTFAGNRSQSTSGADNLAKLFAMTTRRYPDHGNTPRTRHLVLNPIIKISPERTATSRSTFCVVQNTETVPLQPIVVGRYYDTFGCDEKRLVLHRAGRSRSRWSGMCRPTSWSIRRRSTGRHGPTLSASTLMYRVLGGRRPRPLPAPATTARGHGRMPNTC